MKLIDEKGRIFGKINIIDATIIIFIIILLFTGYKYLYLKNLPENILDRVTSREKVWVNVTVQHNFPNNEPLVLNAASMGDIAHRQNSLERNVTIAKILAIDKQYKIESSVITTQARIIYAVLVDKRPDGLYYEDEKIEIGSKFAFNTDIYSLKGIITDIKV